MISFADWLTHLHNIVTLRPRIPVSWKGACIGFPNRCGTNFVLAIFFSLETYIDSFLIWFFHSRCIVFSFLFVIFQRMVFMGFSYAILYLIKKIKTIVFNQYNVVLVLAIIHIYRVLIKYCGFFGRLWNIPDSCLSLFSLGVSVCTHTRQVEHQRCSRTDKVKKNNNILRKNTIFNERPVHLNILSDFKLKS